MRPRAIPQDVTVDVACLGERHQVSLVRGRLRFHHHRLSDVRLGTLLNAKDMGCVDLFSGVRDRHFGYWVTGLCPCPSAWLRLHDSLTEQVHTKRVLGEPPSDHDHLSTVSADGRRITVGLTGTGCQLCQMIFELHDEMEFLGVDVSAQNETSACFP
jgi:hypothetical protein